MDSTQIDTLIKISQFVQGMGLPVIVGAIAGVVIAVLQLVKVIWIVKATK